MRDFWKCLIGVLWLAGTLVPHTTAAAEPEVVKIGADHYRGTGRILDFDGDKAKMRVRYPMLITFNYWVLYKSPDRNWFISADPDMTNLWIYARTVPSKAKLKTMVRKASQLGYDVRKLEFPEQ